MVLGILAIAAIQFQYHKLRWRARMKRLRGAKSVEIATALKRMDPRERAAARLYLGIRSAEPNRPGADDEVVFSYRRPTTVVAEYMYWASLVCAVVPLALLALHRVSDREQGYFLAAGIFFGISVLYQLLSAERSNHAIRVTSFGVQEIRSADKRIGVLWSEVAAIRWRKMPRSLEISAADGKRRIRVGIELDGFTRFLELVRTNTQPRSRRIAMEERLVEESRTTDGWVMSTVNIPNGPADPDTGYAWVIAPNGSRAGFVWRVGPGEFREIMPPNSERWGIYGIPFAKPVLSAQDLADNFKAVLPALRDRYELIQSELRAAVIARTSASATAPPSLRITRICENAEAELVGNAAADSSTEATGAELDPLAGYWSQRAAVLLSAQPAWSVSKWTKAEASTNCVICLAPISTLQNAEHFFSSTGERICARCFQEYVEPPCLGFIVGPPMNTDSPASSRSSVKSRSARIAVRAIAGFFFRALGIAILFAFIWMFLQSWSTDSQQTRILTLGLSIITLVVAFGLMVPSRKGFVFRFFAACVGTGYLLSFYFEAQHFSDDAYQQLTIKTPGVVAGLLVLAMGIPLLLFALHRRTKTRLRPNRGSLYRSKKRVEIGAVMAFHARSAAGFRTTIPEGEIVSIEYDAPSHATAIYAIPQRYNAVEKLVVPPKDRKENSYASYALIIPLEQLTRDFEPVRWDNAA